MSHYHATNWIVVVFQSLVFTIVLLPIRLVSEAWETVIIHYCHNIVKKKFKKSISVNWCRTNFQSSHNEKKMFFFSFPPWLTQDENSPSFYSLLNAHGIFTEIRISGIVKWLFSEHSVPLNADEWYAYFNNHSVIFFKFQGKKF